MGKKRLELLNLTVLVPKTSAYTNSATCPNYAALYIIELICPNGIIGVKINLMSEKTIISLIAVIIGIYIVKKGSKIKLV